MDIALKAGLVLLGAMVLIPAVPLCVAARLTYRGDCARISGAPVTMKRYYWSAGTLTAMTVLYGIFLSIPLATWLSARTLEFPPPHEQRNLQTAFDSKTMISAMALPIDLSPSNDGRPIDLMLRVFRRKENGKCVLDVRNFEVKPVTAGLNVSHDAAVSNIVPLAASANQTCSIGWAWSALPVEGVDDYRVFFAVKESVQSKAPLEMFVPMAIHVARPVSRVETYRFFGQLLIAVLTAIISWFLVKRAAGDKKPKIHLVHGAGDGPRYRSS